ncbi:uncharacterized protein LOC117180463 [Belonocnema kinseyi]|uniref:uncharacterized protein LOC117180463 n=1 Tax=Belonocnema kinseyi TaxID=2817044 RepID=UPI00143D2447|nr:uncharacterized protein LOC117180463 [Belonocnema kinseyi]
MAAAFNEKRLSVDNYRSWKAQFKGLLMGNELCGHVIGKVPQSAAGADAIATWVKNDRKAMSHLLISIGIDEAASYDDLEMSKEIWDKTKETYESGGQVRKALLLKRLTLAQIKEGEDVRKHIIEFDEAVKRPTEIN